MVESPPSSDTEELTVDSGATALANALDVSDEPVYIYDTQGRCQWVNSSGERLLNKGVSEIVGQYIFQLFPWQTRFQIKAWRRVIDRKEPTSYLSQVEVHDETLRYQTSLFPVMDYGGRIRSVVSVGRRFSDKEALQYENEMQGAELALIHEIASILTSSLDIGEVYERFAAEFTKLVNFDRLIVMELDAPEDVVVPVFSTSKMESEPSSADPLPASWSGMSRITETLSTHVQPDLWQSHEFGMDESLSSQGIRSVMRVPLSTRSKVVGMLVLGSFQPDVYDVRAQAMAESVAAQITPAIENARLYREAQSYAQELEVIDEIARVITSTVQIEEVYEQFASEARRLVDFDRISIALITEDGKGATQEYVAPSGNSDNIALGDRWSVEGTGLRWVIAHGTSHIETDLAVSRQFDRDAQLLEAGLKSVIRVPFMSKERVIGAFALSSQRAEAFGPRERRLLERLAAQIAPGIENAYLYREAEQRAREIEVIDEIARIVTSSLRIEEVYERFDAEVKRLIDSDRMSVILADQATQMAVRAYTAGLSGDELEAQPRWPLENSQVGWVVEHLETLIQPDLINPQGSRFANDDLLIEAGFRSGIIVPLLTNGVVIGTFVLWCKEPDKFGDREKRILERLSAQIAPAIENARLYEEVKQTLEVLRETQAQLVQVERLRAMGDLANGVAHDFNNSLAAILGQTQLMLSESLSESQQRSLHLIEKAAQDSAHVVRRILNFAKFDADAEFYAVNMSELIEDVVDMTRHKWSNEAQSQGKIIDVRTHVEDGPLALGNYSELREVLMNLVINAYESISGDGSIDISAEASDEFAFISVADTGVGMNADVQQKIFDLYFTTKGEKGNGLGLSMVFGIISRHNGRIEVDSEEGVGTTMRISLPSAPHVEDVSNDDSSDDTEQAITIANILIVEDEERIRETLVDMLELRGHEVASAANGEEGVSMFKAGSFDIVFTDLGMPGLSGWDVAKAIRGTNSDVPIVMVSGWGVGIDKSEMEKNGVDEMLPKPFDIDEVWQLVQRIMEEQA